VALKKERTQNLREDLVWVHAAFQTLREEFMLSRDIRTNILREMCEIGIKLIGGNIKMLDDSVVVSLPEFTGEEEK
jgi:hypothetical protein